jgi:hypothetical protein
MITIALTMLAQAAAGAPATPPSAKAEIPRAKVECRMIEDTGSRIQTKVCRLDKEWELLAKDTQDDLRNSRNSRTTVANGS